MPHSAAEAQRTDKVSVGHFETAPHLSRQRHKDGEDTRSELPPENTNFNAARDFTHADGLRVKTDNLIHKSYKKGKQTDFLLRKHKVINDLNQPDKNRPSANI